MKKILILFSVPLFLSTCCKEESARFTIDCSTLSQGLLDNDSELIRPIIDSILAQYPSMPTPEDELGHSANFDAFFSEVHEHCTTLTLSTSCYACLESLPAQTPVSIAIDSSGTVVTRQILIYTPANDYMYMNF